jgi:hypothetical protein
MDAAEGTVVVAPDRCVTTATKAKMQFVVSFEEVNPAAKFHGLSKVVLDMPNNDDTSCKSASRSRHGGVLGHGGAVREQRAPAINGQYYGLYVNEEHVGGAYIKRVFPEAPDGDLFAGRYTPEDQRADADKAKLAPSGPRPTSRDGGRGRHGRVGRRVGRRGAAQRRRRLLGGGTTSTSTTTRQGLPLVDRRRGRDLRVARAQRHATRIYWWAGDVRCRARAALPDRDGRSDLARASYIAALRTAARALGRRAPAGWIDAWSAQIADAVAQDPAPLISVRGSQRAIAEMRRRSSSARLRATFLGARTAAATRATATATVRWCNDCNDANPASPGRRRVCGNGIDDNCNRYAARRTAARRCVLPRRGRRVLV